MSRASLTCDERGSVLNDCRESGVLRGALSVACLGSSGLYSGGLEGNDVKMFLAADKDPQRSVIYKQKTLRLSDAYESPQGGAREPTMLVRCRKAGEPDRCTRETQPSGTS